MSESLSNTSAQNQRTVPIRIVLLFFSMVVAALSLLRAMGAAGLAGKRDAQW